MLPLRGVALILALLMAIVAADDATAQHGSDVKDAQPAKSTAPGQLTVIPAHSVATPTLGNGDAETTASPSPSSSKVSMRDSRSKSPTMTEPPPTEQESTTATPEKLKMAKKPSTSSPPSTEIEKANDSSSQEAFRPSPANTPMSSMPSPQSTTSTPDATQPSIEPKMPRPNPTPPPAPSPTEPESPPPVPRLPTALSSETPVPSAPMPTTASEPTPTPQTQDDEEEEISPPPVPRLPPLETSPTWAIDPATSKPPITAQGQDRNTGAGSDHYAADADSEGRSLDSGDSSRKSGLLTSSLSSKSTSGSSSASSASDRASAGLPALHIGKSSASGSLNSIEQKTVPLTGTTTLQSSPFRDSATYISVACAMLSLILLAVFHTFSADTSNFDWPQDWLRVNGWELLLYACYLQQLTSLSHLDLLDAPLFVRQFADAFSWCGFIIQRASSMNGTISSHRRLVAEEIHGVAAYAVRIEIPSSDILLQAIIGLVAVAGIVLFVFIMLLVCGQRVEDDKFEFRNSTISVATHQPTTFRRRGTQTVLGFLVIVWFIALYPITAFASFDLVAGVSNSVLAAIVVVLICIVGLGALAAAVIPQTDERLMSVSSLKLFGALYADMTHGFRWFFIVSALIQVALGVCAGAVTDETTQLTVALVIVAGYVAIVLLCSPFASQTPLLLTAAVCAIKIINYTIAFAFLSDKSVSLGGEERAGDAILALNMAVLLLWLARLLAMLFIFAPLYTQHITSSSSSPAPEELIEDQLPSAKEPSTSTSTNCGADGSGVFVTVVTPMGSRSLDGELGSRRHTARLAVM